MLHSGERGFFFVHTPKCAGTSIRRALADHAAFPAEAVAADLGLRGLESLKNKADYAFDHPALGPIKLDHLPLAVMQDWFPRTFACFSTSTSFCIMREPRARFISAVQQRLREYRGVGAADLRDEDVRREALLVAETLDADPGRTLRAEFVHFARQVDYLRGKSGAACNAVFAIERIDAMFAWLHERFGLPRLAAARSNESEQLKAWARPIRRVIRPAYKRFVPLSVRNQLFGYWRRAGLLQRKDGGVEAFELPDPVEKFIKAFYFADSVEHSRLRGPVEPQATIKNTNPFKK